MSRIPDTIPEGWSPHEDYEGMIGRVEHYGLTGVCSIDGVLDDDPLPDGEYMHMSISRQYQVPGWKECGRYVWESGLFDKERPIMMILWPPKEANQGFDNVFHFWQRLETEGSD